MYENRPGAGDEAEVCLGRDHHPHAFTIWMAGGGIQSGMTYGQTDELGYFVIDNPLHVHDLQATLLHLMGLDHTRLTFRFQGRAWQRRSRNYRVLKVPAILAIEKQVAQRSSGTLA